MAATLELTNYDGSVSIDLLNGTLQLRNGTWQTRTPPPEGDLKAANFGATFDFKRYDPVVETFELIAVGTEAEIRNALLALDRWLDFARQWHSDSLASDSIWLKVSGPTETPRRAFVYRGSFQMGSTGRTSPLVDGATLSVTLTLTRHALWESLTTQEDIAYSGDQPTILALGGWGEWTLYDGSAPGRIGVLAFYAQPIWGQTYQLDKFWFGMRELGAGAEDFTPLWECESGTVGTDAALTKNAGDDASPSDTPTNNKVSVTYATTTLAKRLGIQVVDVVPSGDYTEFVGRYIVLLRCKVSAGTSGVQLRSGSSGTADESFVINEEVYIDNTAWHLINLGEMQLPTSGRRYKNLLDSTYETIKYAELQIWAEEIDGSGATLDLDCLVLIPATHFASGTGAELQGKGSMSAAPAALIYTAENDEQVGFVQDYETLAMRPMTDMTLVNLYRPNQSTLFVVAAERATGSVLGDELGIQASIFWRYLSYRGS